MIAQRIDGRALAENIRREVRETITREQLRPGLGVLLVGSDPASHLYVALKERAAAEAGVYFVKQLLPDDATQEQVIENIKLFNADPKIDGILLQLPLPQHVALSAIDAIIAAIDPHKDVDGFHPNTTVVAPLVRAVECLLKATKQNYQGVRATLLVNSETLGNPLARCIELLGAEPTLCIYPESGICETAAQSGILITAIGQRYAVTPASVQQGATVIDIGTTRVGSRVFGDADPMVSEKAAFISPVPGGVGPLTVAYLLANLVQLNQAHRAER
ncbi:MAG: hypothetical protein A2043_01885 [Candidatus Schekmanbacteria bacterium GWA2_38_9]|nr:MAG: hypothetical protein A2043_01885 [Candidatus Schekmanbacteria bacterium GWA2_38_9]OHB20265.1 MAG: hypothetical protein A2666_03350 [Parcubacteria group bacterium RIFCSPHIGHO2_01_FULL_47_10b]